MYLNNIILPFDEVLMNPGPKTQDNLAIGKVALVGKNREDYCLSNWVEGFSLEIRTYVAIIK
jgi:hypothetical protein